MTIQKFHRKNDSANPHIRNGFTTWRQWIPKGSAGGQQGLSSRSFCGPVLPGLGLQANACAAQDPRSTVTSSAQGTCNLSSKKPSRACCCLLKVLVSSNSLRRLWRWMLRLEVWGFPCRNPLWSGSFLGEKKSLDLQAEWKSLVAVMQSDAITSHGTS